MSVAVTENGGEALVALLSRHPLVLEALAPAFAGVARVERFEASGRTSRLLGWLRPDAFVVDSDELAAEAAGFAAGTPIVHVGLREPSMRVRVDRRWTQLDEPPSPEAVRDVVVGAMAGRRRAG